MNILWLYSWNNYVFDLRIIKNDQEDQDEHYKEWEGMDSVKVTIFWFTGIMLHLVQY